MIDELFETLYNDIFIVDCIEQHLGAIELKESTSQPVKLKKTGKVLVLKSDYSNDKKNKINPFPFFKKSTKSLCSISDKLIFYPTATGLFVFIIEIKTNNTSHSENQIRAGYHLSQYFVNSALRLKGYPNVAISYRGIIFSNKQPIKGTTKPRNLTYLKDIKSNLDYIHLQAGREYNLDNLINYRIKE